LWPLCDPHSGLDVFVLVVLCELGLFLKHVRMGKVGVSVCHGDVWRPIISLTSLRLAPERSMFDAKVWRRSWKWKFVMPAFLREAFQALSKRLIGVPSNLQKTWSDWGSEIPNFLHFRSRWSRQDRIACRDRGIRDSTLLFLFLVLKKLMIPVWP